MKTLKKRDSELNALQVWVDGEIRKFRYSREGSTAFWAILDLVVCATTAFQLLVGDHPFIALIPMAFWVFSTWQLWEWFRHLRTADPGVVSVLSRLNSARRSNRIYRTYGESESELLNLAAYRVLRIQTAFSSMRWQQLSQIDPWRQLRIDACSSMDDLMLRTILAVSCDELNHAAALLRQMEDLADEVVAIGEERLRNDATQILERLRELRVAEVEMHHAHLTIS